MANAVYPIYDQEVIQGTANTSLGGDVKVILVDLADYTYNAAHDFLADIAGAAIVATSGNLASKTFTNGLFDAADITFSAVTGDPCEALIIYIDTGSAATSRLVAYFDTSITGMPVTPNGGDISVTWSVSGIFSL